MNRSHITFTFLLFVTFFLVACSKEISLTDQYGYMNNSMDTIKVITITEDNKSIEGSYITYRVGEETLLEEELPLSGQVNNNTIELNQGIDGFNETVMIMENSLEIRMNGGKSVVFYPVSKQDVEDLLASLERTLTVSQTIVKEPTELIDEEQDSDKQAAPKVNNEEQTNIELDKGKENLILLLEELGTVQRAVIDAIDENGWYQSIDEIEPTMEEFKSVVSPIVSPYFTERFIRDVVIPRMESFFCYCDAPSPLEGEMRLDVTEEINQTNQGLNIYAYRPASEINTGVKFNVHVVEEEGDWKIDGWEPILNSHESSFEIGTDEVVDYYALKGVQLELIETIEGPAYHEDVYIFKMTQSEQLLAVQSRDWYTVEGTELVELTYQVDIDY
ncbi:hypothetical protein GH741_04550 [Aquibacillus halophilus]|uniref:Uncharacterized protein n=1 Tax=Aquibacillus halophilus TaxID=930132 RepID=A0A6A8D855_9BACI|nr:hypothetical protein [Aquibacillus halophilus]MRH41943.1 hypothetical protein [Aquibacillus halophilus]